MSIPIGYRFPPPAPCEWCGRPTRGRDADGEPRCCPRYGVRPVRLVVVPPLPWVPDVGVMEREELLTAAETVAGWAP